ncbi:alpha/beta hydrolase [Nocardia sp. CDC159]|uniref:Alpha/beta hydrolase n=1 Tax=Nocardia pulmonis TaxID=2951408 RepID=A0A9X2J1K7_9NOCA|nr:MULTISPECIES: alpha/beta hydrolase [Nocardia]MCM6778195.1 alpha/beta hydrolase [Nocardia pulmonis]MCM6791084.1 alpha/beta hydrolase [Nocardia sp. CDC159]
MTSAAPQTITLPGGQVVGYAEYGDRGGRPLLYCHGIPGSRLEALALDAAASAAGIRVVAADRPGVGLSSFAPRRRVADWAETVAALADRLRIERFAVLGVSGGGPYALACARELGERVRSVVLVSSIAPVAAGARPGNLLVLRRFPSLARPIAARLAARVRRPGGVAELVAGMPAVDRDRVAEHPEVLVELSANVAEAFRQGSRAVAADMRLLFGRDWGFRLADIPVPVRIWHGDGDRNVPVTDAHRLAAELPCGRVTVVPDAGHLLIIGHAGTILAAVRAEGAGSDDQELASR